MKLSLRALRVNEGLTLKDASKELGISTVTLRSYEYYRTIPNIEVINKILALYKVKIDDINFLPKKSLNKNKYDIKI